jgi:hypothetical protein
MDEVSQYKKYLTDALHNAKLRRVLPGQALLFCWRDRDQLGKQGADVRLLTGPVSKLSSIEIPPHLSRTTCCVIAVAIRKDEKSECNVLYYQVGLVNEMFIHPEPEITWRICTPENPAGD